MIGFTVKISGYLHPITYKNCMTKVTFGELTNIIFSLKGFIFVFHKV